MMELSAITSLKSMLGESMQLSYVVSDLDRTMDFWTSNLNAGPFVVIENAAADRVIAYRGERVTVDMSLAFTYIDDLQIELIAARSARPTPWTDFLAEGREGLHHLGFWPDRYEESCAALEAAGFHRACQIETSAGAVSSNYFSGPPHFGVWVELAPNTPARVQYLAGVKSLCRNWNGKRPVRRYGSREEYMASPDCRA